MKLEQPAGVAHDHQRPDIVQHGGNERAARAQDAARGRGDDDDGPSHADRDIRVNRSPAAPAQTDRRPEPAEIDIDVLTHEGGFASAWARRVAPGGPVAILDEGTMYAPPTDTSWTLLACDESGLPAMANILAGMPRDARGEAYLEIPEPADAQELDPPAGMRVHWLNRAGSGQARAGELMRAAVTAAGADRSAGMVNWRWAGAEHVGQTASPRSATSRRPSNGPQATQW